MADTKISALTAASALGGTEALAGVQSAASVKVTAAQIKTFTSASPSLVTPTLGVATATSINKVEITAPATSATLTIANAKTLTVSNTLAFTGTDASSVAFGAGGTVLYSGGALGTPASGTLTNATGLPAAGVVGTAAILGANVFSGHQTYSADNTYDIGASGATRPRHLYTAGDVKAGTALYSGGNIYAGFTAGGNIIGHWTRGGLNFTADGAVSVKNNAENAFAELQAHHKTHTNMVAETPLATHTVLMKDAAGTAIKVLCLAA